MERIATASNRPDRQIVVTGHTDDIPLAGGPYGDNLGLAAARAGAVTRALVSRGVDPASVLTASRGESSPIADNTTEEGRARNRRIEIDITYAR
ncbi:OmpA/MotB family protein [Celeribacter indicus]|uniref:OmpA/MotB domain-containing protein n=1 Tax=Celeribacter indicus TaxID=1208324 RepID=A0A0B5E7Z3_9RHOB|nr:OmpA family protein [Celeribacter indicus]AJE48422.1 OmpA/MotB domain-containing protein [Celeribacter indicus]